MSSSFDAFAADGEDFGNSAYSTFSSATSHPPYAVGSFPDDEITVDHVDSDPFGFGSDPNPTLSESNGNGGTDAGIFSSDGPVLPPPGDMQEKGFALREWRRENAVRIGEKEEKEREVRNRIIEEAIDFKNAFYEKRKIHIENSKTTNREKEKLYVANQEKFHKEADKEYWKTIGDIIPREVPNLEKRRSKKDQDKKPSIVVVQGPKPGKPTDLARMRHLLLKLKHTPPPHMIPHQPALAKEEGKDAQNMKAAPAAVAGQTAILV
ncbi:clathrin light chain 1-like [Apium graveolens]|uniref:clathrin light chain 1-like n=1 Tax=Apium graveolens TaxID=4045 RepID=UPI003D7B7D35